MTQISLVHRDTLSCEAIVRPASNGGLLIVSQCKGLSEPAPENRVFCFKSCDGGNTWSKPMLVVPENKRAIYQTEFTAWPDGRLWVWITEHDGGFLFAKNYIMESVDDGGTWNYLRETPFFDGHMMFVRGALRLLGGETVFPYHKYNVSVDEVHRIVREGKKFLYNAELESVEIGCIITRDDGKTFEMGAPFYLENIWEGKKIWQWPEPTIAQLSDGTFAMLIRRNNAGALYRADSKDNCRNFGDLNRTDIPNPNNKPKLLNLRDGRIALLNTPNKSIGLNNRHPLEIWVSGDDMKTWEHKKRLISLPGWISYPDAFEARNGEIIISIEFNRHDIYFVRHIIDTPY